MKKVLALALALCMIFTLAACGGSTGTAAAPAAPAEAPAAAEPAMEAEAPAAGMYDVTEPITITWWHALEDQYSDLVNEIVDGFNNSQDLITVEAQYIGAYKDVNEQLVAAVAAGSGLPAVCVANTDYVAGYGASGVFENLDPYIAGTNFDIEDFSAGLRLSSQYAGEQVALPFLHSTQVMYYNKTVADAAGLTVPTDIADLPAFIKAGQEAMGAGAVGLAIPGWDQWYFETMYLNEGVDIITADNTCDLDSETALGVTNMLKAWIDDGIAVFYTGTDASANLRQGFYEGTTFATLHTSSLYNTYCAKVNEGIEVGMAWYPAASTGDKYSEVGGCVLGIPAGNDQATKNAAWVFMQYLTSKENCVKWGDGASAYFPTRLSSLNAEGGQEFLAKRPAFESIFANLDLINPRIQNAAWSQLATTWKNYMDEMLNQGKDITSGSADMVVEINEILEDA